MSNWWVTNILNGPNGTVVLISWVIWVIGSICLHELAHGWMALRCGDSTPRDLGHMTLDPIVHMGVMSLAMFAMIGIAWGAMPVNPSAFRRKHDDALVALAGPMMNLLIALVATVAYILWLGLGVGGWTGKPIDGPLASNLQIFFRLGVALNLALMCFNLLPVPPLDGSRVVASFVPPFRRAFESDGGRVVAMILFIVIFYAAGGVIFSSVISATVTGLGLLADLLVPGLR